MTPIFPSLHSNEVRDALQQFAESRISLEELKSRMLAYLDKWVEECDRAKVEAQEREQLLSDMKAATMRRQSAAQEREPLLPGESLVQFQQLCQEQRQWEESVNATLTALGDRLAALEQKLNEKAD